MKLFFIYAGTGCTCCNDQNHYRGPYATKEDAEHRIAYYKSPESKFWPLASQYARRGHYCVEEMDVEVLGDGRWIIGNKVFYSQPCVEVASDGTATDDEEFSSDF